MRWCLLVLNRCQASFIQYRLLKSTKIPYPAPVFHNKVLSQRLAIIEISTSQGN